MSLERMSRPKFIWNINKTRSIKYSLIKELRIWGNNINGWKVEAQVGSDYIVMMKGETEAECQSWVNATHEAYE